MGDNKSKRTFFTDRALPFPPIGLRPLCGLLVLLIVVTTAAVACATPAPAPEQEADEVIGTSLDEVVRRAAAEGQVVMQNTNPVRRTPAEANQAIADGVRDTFGVEIDVQTDASLHFGAAAARIVSEVSAAGTPYVDLMFTAPFQALPLVEAEIVQPVAWQSLFDWITEDDLELDGQGVVPTTVVYAPAYNTERVAADEVPQRWDDLLDERWAGGRLGIPTSQVTFQTFAEPGAWGEERVVDFLSGIGSLQPNLGRFTEIHQRLEAGEVDVAVLNETYRVEAAQERGAPLENLLFEPLHVTNRVNLIPQNASNPNAAALVAAWFLTEDGQRLAEEEWGSGSMFREGSLAARILQDREWVTETLSYQAEHGQRLSDLYEQLIVRQ